MQDIIQILFSVNQAIPSIMWSIIATIICSLTSIVFKVITCKSSTGIKWKEKDDECTHAEKIMTLYVLGAGINVVLFLIPALAYSYFKIGINFKRVLLNSVFLLCIVLFSKMCRNKI